MKDNEYKCGNCGNIYEKGWSDEEALKEAEANFGKPVSEWKDEDVVICDDCYNLMMPSKFPHFVEKAKKII